MNWRRFDLYHRVREALFALPAYFHTDTVIEGIFATDLFTLNTTLGAAIEQQVVTALNAMRRVWDPRVVPATYAADYRTYYWQHTRVTDADRTIRFAQPPAVPGYPVKSDAICDRPVSDRGRNFGRVARTGIMEAYKAQALQEPLCGIAARHWVEFFKAFQDQADAAAIADRIQALRDRIAAYVPPNQVVTEAGAVLDAVERILNAQ